jgi:hypothetical protein
VFWSVATTLARARGRTPPPVAVLAGTRDPGGSRAKPRHVEEPVLNSKQLARYRALLEEKKQELLEAKKVLLAEKD